MYKNTSLSASKKQTALDMTKKSTKNKGEITILHQFGSGILLHCQIYLVLLQRYE